MPEKKVELQIALLDKLSDKIKSKPEGELVVEGINQDEFKEVLSEILGSYSAQTLGLSVRSDLDVRIKEGTGAVKGEIDIDHPLAGHSSASLDLVFGNSTSHKNTIEAQRSNVNTDLSFLTKIALAKLKIDLDAEIKNKLADPQASLLELFTNQLRKKDLALTGFAANFSTKQDLLLLGFKCKRISPQK